jgi:hypothetical protein
MKRLLLALCVLAVVPLEPAHAVEIRACLGDDLAARANFQSATGAQEGGVVMRNQTRHSCELSGRAVVDFVPSGQSDPLPVVVAAGRATDGHLRDRTIVLASGERAFVHTRWSNWCGGGLRVVAVRLWLQSVEPRVRVRGAISTPGCDDSARSSRVVVGPYERFRRYRS